MRCGTMNDLIIFFIIIVSGCIGYILGRYNKPEEEVVRYVNKMMDIFDDRMKEKPKPGVVRHLTDEELAEKKNPAMKGNKESFDRFFANNPPINI